MPVHYVLMVAINANGPPEFDSFVVDMVVSKDEQSELTLSNYPNMARQFSTEEEAEAFANMSYGTNTDGTPNRPLRTIPVFIRLVEDVTNND